MEDLTQRINQILNDPQSMQMIQSMAQSLGLGSATEAEASPAPPPPPQQQSNFDFSQLASLLGQFGASNAPSPPPAPSIDMSSLLQIQKAMALFANGNKNVDLLRSLRPLLSQNRQKKVDDAIRIMQLIQVLPLLKESGLFGGDGR